MLLTALAVLVAVGGVQAGNPRDGDPAAIQAGGPLFRERCADCHGGDAKGVRGPDLTRLWSQRRRDERAFQTIRTGVPGSIMPSSPAPDDELWAIIAYLRNMGTPRRRRDHPATSSTASGSSPPAAQLSSRRRPRRAARPRSVADCGQQANQMLARAIRDASASFTSGYEPMTLVTRDGNR